MRRRRDERSPVLWVWHVSSRHDQVSRGHNIYGIARSLPVAYVAGHSGAGRRPTPKTMKILRAPFQDKRMLYRGAVRT
eukprot:scaffold60532_cov36-Attheya_sp.AAC.1